MRKTLRIALLALGAVGCLAFDGSAQAQYTGPINPNNPPPYGQPPYNPPPPYNPVVGVTGGSTPRWDGYRWVYDTQTTTILNSATSPGRTAIPGTVQNYNYWNGTQYVQGSRWIGQDGQWHFDHETTTVGPNGNMTNRVAGYRVQNQAPGQPANGQPTAGQPAPVRPTVYGQPAPGQPTYGQPATGQPATGQPTYGQPATGQPTYGQPAVTRPNYTLPGVPYGSTYRPR